MVTNCDTLVADLFLFCYEIDCMLSISDNNQALNPTSRYLDDLLNIDSPHFFFRSIPQRTSVLKGNYLILMVTIWTCP